MNPLNSEPREATRGTMQKIYAYPHKEVRISLHTAYHAQACRMVDQLHIYMLEILETWPMSDDESNWGRNGERLEQLKKELRERVNGILQKGEKRPISPTEVRKRINGWLQMKLDEEFVRNELLTGEIKHSDGKTEKLDVAEAFAESANKLGEVLKTGENVDQIFTEGILELVNDGIFVPEEITTENAPGIIKAYIGARTNLLKIQAGRLKGDFLTEQQIYNAESSHPIQQVTHLEICQDTEKQTLMLSALIEQYCDTQIKDGAWKNTTLSDHRNRVLSLLRILGDKEANKIDRQDMRRFRNTLEQLPPRWNKQFGKGISIEQIIKENISGETLSIKTINVTVEAISGMFKWAVDEQILETNPAIKMFFSDNFTPEKYKNPVFYWAPLISLYTGMRLEEICQLHTEDIYEEDGLWIIDVKEESSDGLNDNTLKTKNSKRKIPIHKKLIESGLIEYRNSLLNAKEIHLFPLLNKTKNYKYGKQVGKRFGDYIKKLGISPDKSFHSLRHTFANFFKIHHLDNAVFTQIFGHEQQTLAGRVYGAKFSTKQCYDEIISRLNYDKV